MGVWGYVGRISRFIGQSFLIMSHDEMLAEVGPPQRMEQPRRQLGAPRGKIRLAADFDLLPADMLASMEDKAG